MWRPRGLILSLYKSGGNGMKDRTSPSPLRWVSMAGSESSSKNEAGVLHDQWAQHGESLYRRLSGAGRTGQSVSHILNQYIKGGNCVKKHELQTCIKELRRYGRYGDALEIYSWIQKRNMDISHGDHAIILNLVGKTKGLGAAEEYFDTLLPQEKNFLTYGSLFNVYSSERLLHKALPLFEHMKKSGMATEMAFSDLMSLHLRTGKPEKVPPLVEEMKSRGFVMTTFSYNVWMKCLASMDDIEGAEMVFEEIEGNAIVCNWTVYTNMAVIYIEAGLHEKAFSVLKKLEKTEPAKRPAYHFLISLYASLSDLNSVKRVSTVMKSKFSTTNLSYLVMLRALSKLNDADGLKECFEEWEARCVDFHARVPKTVVYAYLRMSMESDAEKLLARVTEKWPRAHGALREGFITFFLKNGEEGKAQKHLEASVTDSSTELSSHDNDRSINANNVFNSFRKEGDVSGAEGLCRILKKLNMMDSSSYQSLADVYTACGKHEPGLRRRIQEDQIDISPELEITLQSGLFAISPS